jgi:hypothetical protein
MRSLKIINPTGAPLDTKVIDAETGVPWQNGIESITVHVAQFGITAELLMPTIHLEIAVEGRFSICDPRSGKIREVSRVTFADGEELVL